MPNQGRHFDSNVSNEGSHFILGEMLQLDRVEPIFTGPLQEDLPCEVVKYVEVSVNWQLLSQQNLFIESRFAATSGQCNMFLR